MKTINKGNGIIELHYLDRCVGLFNAKTRIFTTHRSPQHFFIKFNGFGISRQVLIWLLQHGCAMVQIEYTKKDRKQELYEATPRAFQNLGKEWTDLQFDKQLILNRKDFEVTELGLQEQEQSEKKIPA